MLPHCMIEGVLSVTGVLAECSLRKFLHSNAIPSTRLELAVETFLIMKKKRL